MMGKLVDLTGNTFGRLTVLKRNGSSAHKKALWLCACACGNVTTTLGSSLISGGTVSCGCYRLEVAQKHYSRMGERYGKENGKKNDKGRQIKVKCAYCSKQFIKPAHEVERVKNPCCSNECQYKFSRVAVTEKAIRFRKHPDYKAFRLKMIKKYRSCEKCESTDNLIMHHIESYSKYPEKGLDETNIAILCKHCHMQFHNMYGYKHFTKKDYYEWF